MSLCLAISDEFDSTTNERDMFISSCAGAFDINITKFSNSLGERHVVFGTTTARVNVMLDYEMGTITLDPTDSFGFAVTIYDKNVVMLFPNALVYVVAFSNSLELFNVFVVASTLIRIIGCTSGPSKEITPNTSDQIVGGCGFISHITRNTPTSSNIHYIYDPDIGSQIVFDLDVTKTPMVPMNLNEPFKTAFDTLIVDITSFGSPSAAAHVSLYNSTRTSLRQIFISTNNQMLGTPLPSTPPPNNNFCTNPIITITNLQRSSFNGDILEVNLLVQNICFYDVVSRCYQSCSTPADNGAKFTIFLLFINCTLVNGSRLTLTDDIYLYAVLKMTLARLTISNSNDRDCSGCNFDGDYDIKWLLRCNYNELRCHVLNSRYNQFVPILDDNVDLEGFFKFCR